MKIDNGQATFGVRKATTLPFCTKKLSSYIKYTLFICLFVCLYFLVKANGTGKNPPVLRPHNASAIPKPSRTFSPQATRGPDQWATSRRRSRFAFRDVNQGLQRCHAFDFLEAQEST